MTFTYTDVYEDLDSSFVEAVFYNANSKDAVVVLDTNSWGGSEAYRYTSVPPEAVDKLVDAVSVGAQYNTNFKPAYGPGTRLGTFYPQDFSKVSKVTYFDFNATKEHSLGPVFDPTVSGAPLVSDATPEYSLQPLSADNGSDEDELDLSKVVIHYTLSGRKGKYVAQDHVYVEDVLDELEDVLDRLGVDTTKVKIRKVVFKFA